MIARQVMNAKKVRIARKVRIAWNIRIARKFRIARKVRIARKDICQKLFVDGTYYVDVQSIPMNISVAHKKHCYLDLYTHTIHFSFLIELKVSLS